MSLILNNKLKKITYVFTHLSTISYLISSFLTYFHSLVLYNLCHVLYA